MHFSGILDSLVVTEEYRAGSLRDGSIEDDDAYLGDEYESRDGYEDSSSNSDFQPKVRYTFTSPIYFSFYRRGKAGSISSPFPLHRLLPSTFHRISREIYRYYIFMLHLLRVPR